MLRDSQRARVYEAEMVVFFDRTQSTISIGQAQSYCDAITADDVWRDIRNRYIGSTDPSSRVMVLPLRAGHKSMGHAINHIRENDLLDWRSEHSYYGPVGKFYGKVSVQTNYCAHWLLLHELSHIATMSKRIAGHGPEFTGAYLSLVERHLSFEAAERLRRVFRANRVKVAD